MITGVLFLIVSVALHILIPSQIRTYETSAVTAATVPTLLIRGMILCSVILLVQGILSKEKTEYTISGAIFTKENLLATAFAFRWRCCTTRNTTSSAI